MQTFKNDIDISGVKKQVETTKINNRRYLGNKYNLLPFIDETIKAEKIEFKTFADLFAGTGAVSSLYQNKILITNDLLYSNYINNLAWFSPEKIDKCKIEEIIYFYNNINKKKNNYMTKNFSDTFFSAEDCSKIGQIREDIENKFVEGIINNRERAVLITSLLYAMDRIANTVGHYDAYIKGAEFKKHLELKVPLVYMDNNKKNVCYNKDINELVQEIEADLVYLDPPYNSRQYCDAYHLLENVAKWEKPEVFGVAKKMDRSGLKSQYCSNKAPQAFAELIETIKAKYIVLSYNNTQNKANDRSNAKISDSQIMEILSSKGKVSVYEQDYKAFSTGKSHNNDNKERLFICHVK